MATVVAMVSRVMCDDDECCVRNNDQSTVAMKKKARSLAVCVQDCINELLNSWK